MTPTEKARRSDSLYYDTHGANRRNLCDMIAEREDRIEELEAENAKMRELVKHMIMHIEFTSEEDGEPMCWRCPYGKSKSSCDFEQCVAALGIEVDG